MSEQQAVTPTEMTRQQYLEVMETVPDFFEYNFFKHLEQRVILINDQIDSRLINTAVDQIFEFNKQDKDIPVEQRKPIEIRIYSEGGDVISGLALINTIKISKTPVHTYNMGMCASMGAILILSGDRRFSLPDASFLLHDGSLSISGQSAKKAKNTMEYYNDLDKKIKELVLTKTQISEELYTQKENDEWFFFADKALELGMIDEILTEIPV
jgi:ATP-dependent Clp protease protease subunit